MDSVERIRRAARQLLDQLVRKFGPEDRTFPHIAYYTSTPPVTAAELHAPALGGAHNEGIFNCRGMGQSGPPKSARRRPEGRRPTTRFRGKPPHYPAPTTGYYQSYRPETMRPVAFCRKGVEEEVCSSPPPLGLGSRWRGRALSGACDRVAELRERILGLALRELPDCTAAILRQL